MKQEVEKELKVTISDDLYNEALNYAKSKQAYIFAKEGRKVVLQEWYLIKLISEYVISLTFSKFTMDLCVERHNMEKKHSANKKLSAHSNNHIVTSSMLLIK